jgi:predicted esterase YcpF (UPF0227 family)
MIIYIHGFGSSGQGGKANKFRNYFKSRNIPFIAPSLSYVPELAISTLEELIESYDEVRLIGSSLGGYYAIYLTEKYGLKTVLINPAMKSAKTLRRVINKQGLARNYYDESSFEWNKSHVKMLEKYEVAKPDTKHYLLMLQKGDDVLDYNEALEKLPDAKLVLEDGGSHSFDGVERYFEQIDDYLSI